VKQTSAAAASAHVRAALIAGIFAPGRRLTPPYVFRAGRGQTRQLDRSGFRRIAV